MNMEWVRTYGKEHNLAFLLHKVMMKSMHEALNFGLGLGGCIMGAGYALLGLIFSSALLFGLTSRNAWMG